MAAPSRFVVGIDLGTTNCALAWVDTAAEEAAAIHLQDIPQLVNPGEIAPRALLPSFLYLPGESDFPAGQPRAAVGCRRRRRSSASSRATRRRDSVAAGGVGQVVAVAQRASTARAPLLPWGAPAEMPHVSPVDASAAYLQHLAAAWDHEVAGGKRDARAGAAGRPAHRAGVVRRGRARADRRGRRGGRARARHAARGAAGRVLRLARRRSGDGWRKQRRGRRPRPRLRRRRRHDRLHPDRRRRARRRPRARARRGRRSHPARRRQHGPRARPPAAAAARGRRATSSTPGSCTALWHQCRRAKETLLADPTQRRAPGHGARPRLAS